MKKGNYWPQVRCRWTRGYYPQYNYGPPTWCRCAQMFAVYVVELGPLPFPTSITHEDMSDSKYSYVPSDGAVIYRGDWDNGLISGEWSLMNAIDNEFGCYSRFSIVVNDGLLNPRVTYDSSGIHQTTEWFRTGPRDFNCLNRLPGVTPWAFVTGLLWYPMTYGDIRAVTENPDNTHPIIWNDSGAP